MLQWINKKTRKNILKTVAVLGGLLLATVFCLSIITSASAQNATPSIQEGLQIIEQPLGLPTTDIRVIVAKIIRTALGLLGIVMVVLVIYGGFLWMTAGGNETQIGKAKKILINAAIGLAIILSAYAIVSYVIKMLGTSDGGLGTGIGAGGEGTAQNFQGSGALGSVIKDHYPTRDQTGVPRNTKIVVTFRSPIKMDSFVTDKNNNGIFGDCNPNASLNWENDCDSLKTVDDNLINIKDGSGQKIRGAAVVANYVDEGGVQKAYTFTIRPYDVLGNSSESVAYSVRLGKNILLDDSANGNPSAFSVGILGNDYYEWKFACSTNLDTSPPEVISVFPGNNTIEPKNVVIQIYFSEPIDPTGAQGKFNDAGGYYALDGEKVFLKSGNSSIPVGNLRLTNGYRTLEFTSTQACGTNACGGKIFCLPVCDKQGVNCKQDTYEIILKAARTFSNTSFESIPFSGIMDMSGNALNGDRDNPPSVDSSSLNLPVFDNWKQPDNYFWSFKLEDRIETTPPFLQKTIPGPDAMNISADAEWSMMFSKKMRVEPMYDIGIEQYPAQAIPLCKVPRVENNSVEMKHCPFLDSVRQYYLPVITSNVEDVYYNCFYPGKGPIYTNQASPKKESYVCDGSSSENCCKVTNEKESSFCCNGIVSGNLSASTTCMNYWKENSD
ncbi:MAG: hypothetical protein PHY40_04295 [Patescibacteria group bacterium]|nr:hypothetical protein [Patescibacteria group bacterium]